MELNYWASSECVHAEYNEEKSEWSVDVVRNGARTTLRPKQLVFATGAYGPPNVIPLPGVETFQGRHCHSSGYKTGDPYAGKACIVVGSNSSAHDIAADLWECGAKVTMMQRSPTTVVRSETLMELGFEPLYSESAVRAGVTTDRADAIFAATPFRIMHRGQIPIYEEIRRRDAPFYARLAKSGFEIDFGEDEFWPHDEGVEDRFRLLHRRRGLGPDCQRRHRDPKRCRDLLRQGAFRGTHRRLRATGGSHRDGDRIPVDEPRARSNHFRGSGG